MDDKKYCEDCKYFYLSNYVESNTDLISKAKCRNVERFGYEFSNPVIRSKEYLSCIDLRNINGMCGSKGRYFEPKE